MPSFSSTPAVYSLIVPARAAYALPSAAAVTRSVRVYSRLPYSVWKRRLLMSSSRLPS